MKKLFQRLHTLTNDTTFQSASWMIFEKMTRLVLGVFVIALVARHLGPEQFGDLSFSLALLSILIVISSLGLNRILIRELVSVLEHVADRKNILSSAISMRIFAGLLLWFGAASLSIFLLPNNWQAVSLVLFSVVFTATDIIDFNQQAESNVKGISVARTLAFLLSSSIKCLMVWLHAQPILFFVAITLDYALTASALVLYHRINHKHELLKFGLLDGKRARSLLSESWPEIIAGFGAILFMRMDQIMLKSISGAESVGIYSAAIRLSEAWYFLPTAIVAATFPLIVKSREQSLSSYYHNIEMLLAFLVAIALLFVLAMTLLSQPLIQLIYGDGYLESARVLLVHSLGGIFLCLGIASGSWLVAEKRLILNLYRNIVGLIVNFSLNLYLIPRYGVEGAAVATVAGLATAFFLFDLFHPAMRTMFLMKLRAIVLISLYEKIILNKKTASDLSK